MVRVCPNRCSTGSLPSSAFQPLVSLAASTFTCQSLVHHNLLLWPLQSVPASLPQVQLPSRSMVLTSTYYINWLNIFWISSQMFCYLPIYLYSSSLEPISFSSNKFSDNSIKSTINSIQHIVPIQSCPQTVANICLLAKT